MHTCDASTRGVEAVYHAARSLAPFVTDKVSHDGSLNGYETMYGIFLIPLLTNGGVGLKILEIGLGCDYSRGNAGLGRTHGASARLLRALAPEAQIWEAEYDRECVAAQHKLWRHLNISTLVGDQGNSSVVKSWIAKSGGGFNIVIDDGSHRNHDVYTSFMQLWPEVQPAGLYFIEDLQVGRHAGWDDTHGEAVMADVLSTWTEQLLVSRRYSAASGCYSRLKRPPAAGTPMCPDSAAVAHVHAKKMRDKFPLPPRVAFIFCQTYGCVVGKRR